MNTTLTLHTAAIHKSNILLSMYIKQPLEVTYTVPFCCAIYIFTFNVGQFQHSNEFPQALHNDFIIPIQVSQLLHMSHLKLLNCE